MGEMVDGAGDGAEARHRWLAHMAGADLLLLLPRAEARRQQIVAVHMESSLTNNILQGRQSR